MLFNSYAFLLFLPTVFLLYWALPRKHTYQNALLLIASYVFYACWDVRFLILIVAMTWIGYECGRAIESKGVGKEKGKRACVIGCIACLTVLGAFKYYDFFVENLNCLVCNIGFSFCMPLWRVVLPIGISFYTFQLVGYMVDVYKGRLAACHDALSFATFVAFFPQLVAGPIERASDLLRQMELSRKPQYEKMVDGARLILWGFVKKMLLADRCAPIVTEIFNSSSCDGTDLWVGTILFAFQIYGDFSGYSDIAVGTARLFGIQLTRNFNLPYFSRNVNEFWRRWHITLMSWFRDYIYIPLGGSHKGKWITLRNVSVVFLISGLWHGANWTFVVWGVYFALWGSLSVLTGWGKGKKTSIVAAGRFLPHWKELLQMIATFLIVCIGWVFFRSESISSAFCRLGEMFTNIHLHSPYGGRRVWIVPFVVLIIEWISRERVHPLYFPNVAFFRPRIIRWLIYYALIFVIFYFGGEGVSFIYSQF